MGEHVRLVGAIGDEDVDSAEGGVRRRDGIAREMGRRAAENRLFPLLYVVVVFFYVPGMCIYLGEYGLRLPGVLLLAGLPTLIVLFEMISKAFRKRALGK